MPPAVSVVMPVYNGERYLAETIGSVLGQTYADFELIVVDDGSSDSSAQIALEFAGRDSRIQCIPLSKNGGKASARNRGIEAARGVYIAVMDCDDICLPNRLHKQVTYLQANPQIDVVGCTMWIVDEGLTPRAELTVPMSHPFITWGLFFSPSIAGNSTVIRLEVLVAAGGYEEGRTVCDDLELWSRLIGRVRFANLPDVLMFYRRHPQATGVLERKRQREEGAEIRRGMLERLCGNASEETIDRFERVWRHEKDFRRAERNLLRAEMTRLIESFVEAGWIETDERPLLTAAMEETLQRIKPRRRHFWKHLL